MLGDTATSSYSKIRGSIKIYDDAPTTALPGLRLVKRKATIIINNKNISLLHCPSTFQAACKNCFPI